MQLPASQALCHAAAVRFRATAVKIMALKQYLIERVSTQAARTKRCRLCSKKRHSTAGRSQSAATVRTSISSGSCTSRSIIKSVLGG